MVIVYQKFYGMNLLVFSYRWSRLLRLGTRQKLLDAGNNVVCFDVNVPKFEHPNLLVVTGDIRDGHAIQKPCVV